MVVNNYFLSRISMAWLHLGWRVQKHPQCIPADALLVVLSSRLCFAKTLTTLAMEPFFTTLLGRLDAGSAAASIQFL